MKSYNRFIPGEEIANAAPWQFGSVGAPPEKKVLVQEVVSAEAALAAAAVVRDEGYAAGFSEGFVQGHAQAVLEAQKQLTDYMENTDQEKAQRFGQLLASVQAQLALSEAAFAGAVLSLACEIARKILGQEISVNTNAVLPAISQGLTYLIDGSKSAKIRLNPLDFEALEERLLLEFSDIALTLVPDPLVACGGCVIESEDTVVDGTVEKRWSRVLASLGLKIDWSAADEP